MDQRLPNLAQAIGRRHLIGLNFYVVSSFSRWLHDDDVFYLFLFLHDGVCMMGLNLRLSFPNPGHGVFQA